MHIEVVTPPDTPPKVKGDLFEALCSAFVRTQGYAVTEQVRITGSELDLLCNHHLSRESLYVECKAQRDPLGATPIKALLGTLGIHEYDQGWLVSAGPLGKDAKGLQQEWAKKPSSQQHRLRIYDPEAVLKALIDAHVIVDPDVLPIPRGGPKKLSQNRLNDRCPLRPRRAARSE